MSSSAGNVHGCRLFTRFFFDRGGATPYYCALMSEGTPKSRLKRLISPRKLAYSSLEIAGAVPSEALERLAEAADCSGDVEVSLAFSINEEGKLIAQGSINADMSYTCQRCLKPIAPKAEHINIAYGIVKSEEEAKHLPSSLDPWIVSEDETDVYEQIEDELLLAVPVVAYHDDACIDESLLSSGDEEELQVPERDNPFSVLSSLKTKGSEDSSES